MKIKKITYLKKEIPTYDFEVKNQHHYLLSNGSASHNTSLIVGTTASVMPIYKKYFVETNAIAPTVNVAPNLNQDNFWYYKEYSKMKVSDVIDIMSTIQKWIDQSISFEWLMNPQETSPKDIYNWYIKSWEQGIKTIYYTRSMSLEIKETCESCSG